jgi:alkylated DNA repair dioxygenase AlkB
MKASPFNTHELMMLKRFYAPAQCDLFLRTLLNKVSWSDDYYMAFDRRIEIPRRQAWYADAGIRYSYSNNLLNTQPWIAPLSEIKQRVETALQRRFNSVLLTYYRDGGDSVSWHADDEPELGSEPWIASLSLGASRDFHFRHRQNGELLGQVTLHHGDLLLMRPSFQHNWEHCVPEQRGIDGPRINLTFRNVLSSTN